ncbi:unnamed protein product [Clonostachys rosea]|uniref:non-specific serine/threonine protein kinase n=1 Tax=Bionectria ochroleuca TaxID=29856 RepID=A0ABY6UQX6_BIOOC|nr:unnamed protein product [Clonostachys rosea]
MVDPRGTMLNVESGADDIRYRIKRDNQIIYVHVLKPDIIPEDKRTCDKDVVRPHSVPAHYLMHHPFVDISALTVIHESKYRTSEVSHNGQTSFLKIARFPDELKWIIQEIQAYHALSGSSLVSKLLAYISESLCADRIIGFLVEKVNGRRAELEDLESCENALDQLHASLVHGDLCKYNIFITDEGPNFIDLEDSVLVGTDAWSDELKQKERQGLASKLADTSGLGRPWEC